VSDPIDGKALEEYLKGDSAVSRRYRELGSDEVSPELDRRVLAEAQAAVEKRSTAKSTQRPPHRWLLWGAPLAVAASAVLVFSIVLEGGLQENVILSSAPLTSREPAQAPARESVQHDAQAPAAASPAPIEQPQAQSGQIEHSKVAAPLAGTAAPAAAKSDLPTTTENKRERSAEVAPHAAVSESRIAPAFAGSERSAPPVVPPGFSTTQTRPVRPPTDERTAPEASDLAMSRQFASAVMHEPAAGAANDASTVSVAASFEAAREQLPLSTDPQRWLEYIRELRKDGKTAQADHEWQRFLDTFPNYTVSDTDAARPPPKAAGASDTEPPR
jgi:hypothetical protein